ncbi:MAG: hypothetical protein OEY23_05920, partial [Acidimicrobiia bacterium]|nr:hypothetical protein [Acidimicrobiia bacterium]
VGLWNSADGRQWTPADLPQGAAGSPRGSLEATDEALFVDYLDPAAADGLAVWSTRNLTQWLSIWFPPGVVDARSDAAIFLGAGSRFAMVSTTSVHIGEVGPFAEVFWLDRIPLPRWPSDGARPSAAMTAKGFVLFDNSDPAGQLWLLADGPRWLPLSGPDDMPVGKDGSGLEAARAEVTAIADLGAGLVLAGAVVPSDEDRPSPRPLAVWNWTPQG